MVYKKTIKLRCIYKEQDIFLDFIKNQEIYSNMEIKLKEDNVIINIISNEKININHYTIIKNIFNNFNIEYFEIEYSYCNIYKNLYNIVLNDFDINKITDKHSKFKIEEIIEDYFSNINIIKEIKKGKTIDCEKCYRLFLIFNCNTEHIIRYTPYRYSFKEFETVDSKLMNNMEEQITLSLADNT